ncbi:MAG: hypothetical protein JWO06_206 [Bacteroidota bacterium]|nr:hypothetical protein [Bacteroidota bacterium]
MKTLLLPVSLFLLFILFWILTSPVALYKLILAATRKPE